MAKTKSPRRSGRRARPGRRKVACWLPADLVATLKGVAGFRGCELGLVVEPALRAYLGRRSYVVDGETALALADPEGQREAG